MKKITMGLLFGFVVGVSIAFAIGLSASPETANRNVMISVSGLPSDRTVEVWSGSEKLTSFQSDQPVQQLVIPYDLDKIAIKSPPLQHEVYNEKIGKNVSDNIEPGVRYFTEKSEYDLAGIVKLEVKFKKQYEITFGAAATVQAANANASNSILDRIQVNPVSKNGFYDAGATVTVTVPEIDGIQFAYWIIEDASNGNVSPDIRQFSSADNPIQITLNHPINVFGRFVGEWEQLPDQKASDMIVVQNLVEGQKVEIIKDGISILEKTVETGVTEAKLPVVDVVTKNQLSGVQIYITAPDGKTVIFQSPVYDSLSAGNQFFF
ncbi:MAG: hypothetical protein GX434_05605 [Peptococcaceae bacterium]|nr:hypothetical protein [Peptococcaceae bacterium]